MATKRKRHYRTKRIYYGPEGRETSLYWTVRVSDARKPVTLEGDVLHALKAYAGVTIGCALSNVASDKRNHPAFPHPVKLAAFTKSTALIVDQLRRDGSPFHAVLYTHRYGHITDRNDDRTLKKMVSEQPSVMERSFTLHPPRKRPPSGKGAGQTPYEERGKTMRAMSFVPRGALRRAEKAGRIGKNVADQLAGLAAE